MHIHWIISMCGWTWNSIVHKPVISNGLSDFLDVRSTLVVVVVVAGQDERMGLVLPMLVQ